MHTLPFSLISVFIFRFPMRDFGVIASSLVYQYLTKKWQEEIIMSSIQNSWLGIVPIMKRSADILYSSVVYSTTDKVIPTLSIQRAFKSTSFLVASQSILNLISLKPDERITKPLKLNLSYESSLISWSSSLGGWMESS